MSSPESVVRARLKAVGFPPTRVTVHKGFVTPGFGGSDRPERVGFAYVDFDFDFDFFEPIKVVLDALESRLNGGAPVRPGLSPVVGH
jgi:hypothetical protein